MGYYDNHFDSILFVTVHDAVLFARNQIEKLSDNQHRDSIEFIDGQIDG